MLKHLFEKLRENKLLVLVIFLYFFARLINLTTAPLFNDEAIYLDWGFRETHREGFLFYSLYDGKQPFLMWIFGILQAFFSPTFSGRIVSVFAGFLTLIGLYKSSEILFNKHIGVFSSFLYTVIPIFSFYDRQALMESSVAAVGVWAFYFLIKFIKNKNYKYAIALGLILGIGFFIKTTSFVFFLCSFLIILYVFSYKKERSETAQKTFVFFLTFFLSIFLLIINPQFWNTLGSNSRYVFSLNDLFTFPVSIWVSTLFANIEISFFYLTPLVFLASIAGIILLFKSKELDKRILVFYFLFSLVLETLTVRAPSERYLVAFLPFAVVAISLFVYTTFKKTAQVGIILLFVLVLIPLYLTFFQVLSQPGYILLTGRFTNFNHSDYLEGFSSGYGVNEVIDYIKKLPNEKKIVVGLAENTGNPESAILVSFAKDKYIQTAYFDSKLIREDISGYDCLKTPDPTFFVSRDDQKGGLDKFLEKIETFKNPYGKNTIGIYKLKTKCSGKILEIHPEYSPI